MLDLIVLALYVNFYATHRNTKVAYRHRFGEHDIHLVQLGVSVSLQPVTIVFPLAGFFAITAELPALWVYGDVDRF
jgi:hypothetical protein